MISKELLNEVLNDEVGDYFYYNDNLLWFEQDGKEYIINIYEFAHKCKEWALNKNKCLSSTPYHKRLYVCTILGDEMFESDTEVEAIFKACQYIMEN